MYQLYLNNHLKWQFLVTFHLSSCNNVSIVCYFFSKKVRGLHIVYIELSKKAQHRVVKKPTTSPLCCTARRCTITALLNTLSHKRNIAQLALALSHNTPSRSHVEIVTARRCVKLGQREFMHPVWQRDSGLSEVVFVPRWNLWRDSIGLLQ